MADGYGNIVNNAWRCWCAAWVVSETDTTATIRVEARQQTVNGWTLVGWASGSVNCDGQSASGNSASQTIPTNGYATRYSRDFTVAKQSSARNVWCSASVSWNGTGAGASNAGVNVAIGGIRYKAPNAPSGLSVARVDDTAANLTWKNNPDNNGLKPYQQIIVDRRSLTGGGSWGAWGMIASLGGTATNYRATGLKANSRYQFRILARNQGGDSAHVETAIISTTPAAPRSVTAVKTSGSTVTVTADVSNSSASWVTFRRSTDGGATWTVLTTTAATGVVPSNGKAVYKDTSAPAGTVQYRCFTRRVIIGDTISNDLSLSLASKDPTDSNTVTTITPPLAPTVTSPTVGSVISTGEGAVTVSWVPNHPDGSAQTGAQIELTRWYSGDGSGAVPNTIPVTGSTTSYPIEIASFTGAWRIRVRTKGLHADWGAWSVPVTCSVHNPPSIVVTAPGGDITASPFDVAWSVSDRTGVSEQTVTVSGGNGGASLTVPPSQTGVTVGSADYLPADGEQVTITVSVRGGSGLTGSASILRTVSYTPPAAPSATVTQDDMLRAVIAVRYGSGSGPATVGVDVSRVDEDGTVTPIVTGLVDGQQGIDPLPPLNTSIAYRLTAWAGSGASASTDVPATVESSHNALSFGADAGVVLPLGWSVSSQRDVTHDTVAYDFADDSPYETVYDSGLVHAVTRLSDTRIWARADYLRILNLAEQYSAAWYRDVSGLRERVMVDQSMSDSWERARTITWSATMTRIPWKEPA